jgi:hypothetical protein
MRIIINSGINNYSVHDADNWKFNSERFYKVIWLDSDLLLFTIPFLLSPDAWQMPE